MASTASVSQFSVFQDGYAGKWVELDDLQAQLRTAKQAAKQDLDAHRADRDSPVAKNANNAAQYRLTQVRTRAALETLLRLENDEAPPELTQEELELPSDRFLIQHFCVDKGFASDMQLRWVEKGLQYPRDLAGARDFLRRVGARYLRHADLTREQPRTALRQRILEQMDGLTWALRKAASEGGGLEARQANLPPLMMSARAEDPPPPMMSARPLEPYEHDVTYSPAHRNVFAALLKGAGDQAVLLELQTTCASRRRTHPLFPENQKTAEFYNEEIAPHTAHWVEIRVTTPNQVFYLKVHTFFAEGVSVVHPFIAHATTEAADFRDRKFKVVELPPCAMQGRPSEMKAMVQAVRAYSYVASEVAASYRPLKDTPALMDRLAQPGADILEGKLARAYYSVEDRKKGDSVVYFVYFNGNILGAQIHTPEVRQLWWDPRSDRDSGRRTSGVWICTPRTLPSK